MLISRQGRMAWRRRSVCRSERRSKLFGLGSSTIWRITTSRSWRSWLGCEFSLRALTLSASSPNSGDGSGAPSVRAKALPSHVPSPSIHGTRPSTGALKNMKKLPLALAAPGSHYGTAAAFRRERPSVAGRPGCPRRFGSGRARRGLTGPQRAALCVLRAGGLRPAPALAVMLWPTANRSIEAPAIRR